MTRRSVLVPVSGAFTGRLEDIRLRKVPDEINTDPALDEYICLELLKFHSSIPKDAMADSRARLCANGNYSTDSRLETKKDD